MRGLGEAERGGHGGGRGPPAAQHVQRGQVGDGELHARHCRTITGMDAAAVETRLTTVLGAWAAGSVALGGALSVPRRTRGFGRQTAAWGAVDGAIAAAGARNRARRGPTDPARLRKVLLVNAGLDVGYLAVGAALLRRDRWRGDGAAVLVQGAFLLVLDGTAARALRAG